MRILKCENATHEPAKVGWNADGSYDLGVAQINSIHKERVERLFGEPFDTAMRDPWKNLSYAALKYQEEGERPWTCSRIV